MDYSVGLAQSQRVLKQRNMLGIVALVLAGLVVLLFLVGATRDREIVLQPIVRSPLTLSSSGVSEQYLGSWAALLLSAVIFGLLHTSNPNATVWSSFAVGLAGGGEAGAVLTSAGATRDALLAAFRTVRGTRKVTTPDPEGLRRRAVQ